MYKIFGIFDNMIEIDLTVCGALVQSTSILGWLLDRLQSEGFDEIKGYAAELLSILLQNDSSASVKAAELNGIEILLIALSKYKKINPPTLEEEEYVENLFNSLTIASVIEENKKYFTDAEGLNLLKIFVKNKRFSRKCALMTLNFVLADDRENCERFIKIGGLGTIFSAYLMKGSNKHKKGFSENDLEHCVSIIVHLFNQTEDDIELFARVLNKFRENDFEKIKRLLELHEQYATKVKNSEIAIQREIGNFERLGIEIDEDIESELFLQRLDAGLFTLQKVDYLIALLMNTNDTVKDKIVEFANQQQTSSDEVKKYLTEYAESIGEANDEKSNFEKLRIIRLLETFA